MRTHFLAATLLAFASLISSRAAGETNAELTSDQQSFISLAIRDDIRRPANKAKFGRGTIVCLSAKIDEGQTTGDGDRILRDLRIPATFLEHLSAGGLKYVPSDQCVVRDDEKIRLAGSAPTPAVLVEIEISDAAPSFARASVAVSTDVYDSSAQLTDTYAAHKTKRGWAITHEGHIDG